MTSVELLEDVLGEFLLMLPVKCLLRFRCVCKAWCALIDNSRFIAKHHNRATFNKKRMHLC
ncbi:hypothetical protein LguiB_004071 [Lonicera macranthoides]